MYNRYVIKPTAKTVKSIYHLQTNSKKIMDGNVQNTQSF